MPSTGRCMSTISGIVFFTSGRKRRSTASPRKPSSMGGRADDRRQVDGRRAAGQRGHVEDRESRPRASRNRCGLRTDPRGGAPSDRRSPRARSRPRRGPAGRRSSRRPPAPRAPRRNPAKSSSETPGGSGATAEKTVAGSQPIATTDLHAPAFALVAARLPRSVLVLLPVHSGRAPVEHLHPVHADVGLAARRIPRDDERHRHEWSGVLRPARQHRKRGEIHRVAGQHDLLARRGSNGLREHRRELRDPGDRLQLPEDPLRRLGVQEEVEALVPLLPARDLEGPEHPPARRERVDHDRDLGALHVLEEKRRTARTSRHGPRSPRSRGAARRAWRSAPARRPPRGTSGTPTGWRTPRDEPLTLPYRFVRVRARLGVADARDRTSGTSASMRPTSRPRALCTAGSAYGASARRASSGRTPSRDMSASVTASRARAEPSSILKAAPTASAAGASGGSAASVRRERQGVDALCPLLADPSPAARAQEVGREPSRAGDHLGLADIARTMRALAAADARSSPGTARAVSRAYASARPESGSRKTGALHPSTATPISDSGTPAYRARSDRMRRCSGWPASV